MQSRDAVEAGGVDLGSVIQKQLKDFRSVELSGVLQRLSAAVALRDVDVAAEARKASPSLERLTPS